MSTYLQYSMSYYRIQCTVTFVKILNVQPGLAGRTIVCPHPKFRIQIFPISRSREPGISDPNPYQGWVEKCPERWREGGIWRRHEGRVVTVARGGCGNGSPDTAQWLATLHRRNRMSHLGQERSCDRTERGTVQLVLSLYRCVPVVYTIALLLS